MNKFDFIYNDFKSKQHLDYINWTKEFRLFVWSRSRGKNPDKREAEFELPEKIKDRQIIYYDGLLTDMMCNLGYNVTLIRGLRNATDLQYELTQYQFLQEMMPGISIVNIFCDRELEHISGSSVRNLMKYEDVYKKYLI